MMDKKPLIVVLDDDPDISIMIRTILEFKGGYEVRTFNRAENAEEFLANNDASLIIMDMLLSGSNGCDICRKFKNDPALKDIPVIMSSAHPLAKEACLEAGANDFLAKPFEINDLFTQVRALLN